MITGVTGAGKTTGMNLLASALSRPGAGYATIDVDDVGWAPASQSPWTQRPDAAQYAMAETATAQQCWVSTRPWRAHRELVLERADLVIYLDYSPAVTLRRLAWRTLTRVVSKKTCCNGNRQTLSKALGKDSILVWWKKTVKDRHSTALAMEAAPAGPANPSVLRLTKPSQFDALLAFLPSFLGSTPSALLQNR